jgi:hypothetical protein
MTRRRPLAALLAATGALLLATSVTTAIDMGQATAATTGSAVTVSAPISRVDRVGGVDHVVESSTFSLTVSQTQLLRDRQEVSVTWKGGHPTGGIVPDQNSSGARNEEYPVVVLQCRGLDSTAVPSSQRVSPETCWTASSPERYAETYNSAFPAWRIDRFASPAQRTDVVGAPGSVPRSCYAFAPAQYWVPFRGAGGSTYYGGPNGCAGMAPESANVDGSALPSNTTYGVTAGDGRGQTGFDIWTDESNASLGCSSTVRCSLVAVPVLGLSCDVEASALPPADRPTVDDAAAAEKACTASGAYAPGEGASANASRQELAVTGSLWWAASNWRNRVSVPLTFAPSASVCDVVSSTSPVDLYGTELLTQATQRWAPAFCTDPKLFRFRHVHTGEPEARTILRGGSIDAALVTSVGDPAYGRPVVQAPVAVTGFSVGYAIDAADGTRYHNLHLTPRLLAKLITQSYPAILDVQHTYAALSHNPLNISLDPEFHALNPQVTQGVAASEAASTLVLTSSDSDVIWALTAYIDSDPEARAWLSGAADPWGMVVNPNYKGITLPVTSWPLRDTFQPTALYQGGQNDCLLHNPVPYLPLVAAPVAHFADITQALQFSLSNSTTVCKQQADGVSEGERLVPLGRQRAGFRFMIGVLPLADADRYGVDSAALQTRVASGAGTAFTSAEGRAFVVPSLSSLRRAASLLIPDAAVGAWRFPYGDLGTPAGSSAYPGLEVVYAAVPTTGLPATSASQLASFIRRVIATGQAPGLDNGQLPQGYLPLSSANGLGALVAYSARAANAIAGQTGHLPSLTQPDATPTPTLSPTPSPSRSRVPVTGPAAGSSSTAPAPQPSATAVAPARTVSPSASAVTPTPEDLALAASRTPADDVGTVRLVLPGLLGAAGVGALLAAGAALGLRGRR